MIYTPNNWVKFLEKDDCFIKIPKYKGSLLSYKEECYKVAEKYKQFDKVWVALSGGDDCVAVLLLFKQIGINVAAVTYASFFNDKCYNMPDVVSAKHICQKYNLEHKIVNIGVNETYSIFYDKYDYVDGYSTAVLCYLAEKGYQPLVTGKGDLDLHIWRDKNYLFDLSNHWLTYKARDKGLEIYDFWNSTRELSLSGFRDSNAIGTKAYASLHNNPLRPPDISLPKTVYFRKRLTATNLGYSVLWAEKTKALVCDFDLYVNGDAVIYKVIDKFHEGFQDWIRSCDENQIDYIKNLPDYEKIKNKFNFKLDAKGNLHV